MLIPNLAIFARLGSRPIPRVLRMMDVAKQSGFETLFLSARREQGLPDMDTSGPHPIRRMGRYFPLLNGRAPHVYVLGVLLFNVALFREFIRLRPALVHCSDIEAMPAAVAYRLIRRCRLIYNIHDNLSERYNIPLWARRVLNVIEGAFVLTASVTLVPEEFRRDTLPRWSRHRVQVVRNTPRDRGVAAMPEASWPIRIFFGGWLDWGRGLRQLLELVGSSQDFYLTIAGEGSPEIVREIENAPKTRYLGFVSHDQVMDETAKCHFVAALYSPHRPINRHAASNKLAEALSLGRPALVNDEMLIVRDLKPYQCLVVMPYERIASDAACVLRSLIADSEGLSKEYRAMCGAAREAYEKLYSWEVAEAAMRASLFDPTAEERRAK